METIALRDIEGFARLSGTDEDGATWTQFVVNPSGVGLEETGECTICGTELEDGWMCLDGGDEVCNEHVTY